MKTRLFITLAALSLCSLSTQAQQLERQVVSSSGTTTRTAQYSLSWTLGEVATTTLKKAPYILTQGFQQANILVSSDVTSDELAQMDLSVFPNPAVDHVQISMRNYREGISLNISDLAGKSVLSKTNISSTETIDLSSYASGNYQLTLMQDGRIVGVYSIIKVR